MHDITNDRFTALESISTDQLTAVTGGTGEGTPPPGDGQNLGRKAAKGLGGLLFERAVSFITRPPSDEFKAYMHYEAEARRSRLLSDAYRGGR